MFLSGKAEHQVDDRLRFRMPAKFKTAIGSEPFIACGTDKCLYIYDHDSAEKRYREMFSSVDIYSDDPKLKKMRDTLSSGEFVTEDKQGRLSISQDLAKEAGIVKDIVTIGMIDHVELWAKEEWEKYRSGNNMKSTFREEQKN